MNHDGTWKHVIDVKNSHGMYGIDQSNKLRFRLFLLMIRQMFLVKKRVPENHYGKNFMHVTDEVLLKEAKELYTKMKKAKG